MSTQTLNLQAAHILVVDDDPDTRFLNLHALKRMGVGYTESVGSVPDMFYYLNKAQTPVELILMDVMMPGVNGIEGVRQLHQHPTFADIPVIMLTTLNATDKLSEAFDAGANDYLTKPFRFEELQARVTSVLKKQAAFNQLKAKQNKLLEEHETLKMRQRNLERNAYADGLTKIPNRRAFDDALSRLWKRCKENKTPIGMLLSDVDYFKRYNDIYGHQMGDECLVKVAQNLPALTSETVPARYGGEEFAVLFSGNNALHVSAIAQQICQRILDLKIPHMGSELKPYVTISVGCTYIKDIEALETSGFTPEKLLNLSDEALYEAKRKGRSQVAFFDISNETYTFHKS